MKLSSIGYVLSATFSAMKKNFFMTFVAVLTVTIALFLCAVFWLLVVNIDVNASQMEDDVEIIAYLDDEYSQFNRVKVEQAIDKLNGVASYKFVSKEEGMDTLSIRFSGVLEALEGDNPLPDSYTVKAVSPDYVASIARALENIEGINKVRYGMGSVEQIFSFTSTMREVGLALMLLLGVAAIVLIAMSTRISVYARQKEIMIMKWIGSTNAFIRWPFLLEGILIGFIGSVLALCATYFAYGKVLDYLVNTLPFMTFVSPVDALSGVVSIMLLAGILMGALGSAVSVARFLDV